MAIFTVLAVKFLKIIGMWLKFLFHAVKNLRAAWKIPCREKGQWHLKYFTPWNKVVMSEKISRCVTKWTFYINMILLSEHYALIVSRHLQRFHCRHYWMSFRIGYLSTNRQLAVSFLTSLIKSRILTIAIPSAFFVIHSLYSILTRRQCHYCNRYGIKSVKDNQKAQKGRVPSP